MFIINSISCKVVPEFIKCDTWGVQLSADMNETRQRMSFRSSREKNGVNKILSSELFFIFLQGILLSLGISIFEGHISESTILIVIYSTLQFSLVAQLCPILCSPMDCSTPGFPVHHQLPGLAQTQVH